MSARNAINAAMAAVGAAIQASLHASSASVHIGYNRPARALASLTSAHVAALELIWAIEKAREELK